MKLLTKRKAKWVGSRKNSYVNGTPLNLPTAIERRYAAELEAMANKLTAYTEREWRRFFNQPTAEVYFAEDASVTTAADKFADALYVKVAKMFDDYADKLAEKFTNRIDKASSAAVHSSVEQMSGGLSLPTSALKGQRLEVLKSSVAEQVSLIRSIPIDYLGKVTQAVQRSIASGRGLADLVPFLEQQAGVTRRRAKMIALDQTRKAYNNMNAARIQQLGMTKFRWLHTGGSNQPRELHKELSGQVFSFDDPPVIDEKTGERGLPGQAINCRCRMSIVLEVGNNE